MIWNKKLKGGEVIQYTLSQWWTRLTEAFSPSRSLSQPQWKTSYHLQQNYCSEDKTRQSAKEDPKWPNQWWLQSSQHRHTLSGINLDRLGIIEIPKWKKRCLAGITALQVVIDANGIKLMMTFQGFCWRG